MATNDNLKKERALHTARGLTVLQLEEAKSMYKERFERDGTAQEIIALARLFADNMDRAVESDSPKSFQFFGL
jgi:hypothetical protein